MNMIARLSYIILLVTVVLIVPDLRCIQAYPWRAGHCKTGSLAYKSGGEHDNEGGGSLSNGGLQVTIGNDNLSPGSALVIDSDTTYSVRLNGSFKGFLFRLESEDGYDVSESFQDLFINVQRFPSAGCPSGVVAMTHDNANVKSSINFNMNVPHFASSSVESFKLRLDVTVVIARDDWYYDLFEIVVQPSTSTTMSPTLSPTTSAIDFPSSSPSKKPISTSLPTNAPSSTLLGPPSLLPTTKPTTSPTAPPTSPPTTHPTFTPTVSSMHEPSPSPTESPPPTIAPSKVEKEGKYTKFALRFESNTTTTTNNNNNIVTKNCNWLKKRPSKIQRKYCRNRKYQLYFKSTNNNENTNSTNSTYLLPASRICFETCSSYCVEQRQNALFLIVGNNNNSGEEEVVNLRQCKWLASKSQDVIDEVCNMSSTNIGVIPRSSDYYTYKRFGVASEVCTEICLSEKSC